MSDEVEISSEEEGVPANLQARFPNMHIERLVARGGMGAVYRAVQTQLDRPVALKILPDEFATDEVRRNLFVREARSMAKLMHPHLVQLFDFGEVDGLWYMVQEWVSGQTLFDHQKAGVLEISDGTRLVDEVCSGLQHAHENGVIHRDIKPANIIIDYNGTVKLTDFGLAKSTGGEEAASEEEDCFGTPEYAAPELFVDGAVIDHRADIFAVGVLLYELLTGQQPGENYVHPSEVIGDLNEKFDAVVSRAMQHDPAKRYQSCAELAADLREAVEEKNNKPVSRLVTAATAPNTSGGTRPVALNTVNLPSSKSGGMGGVMGIIVGLALAAGGIWFFVLKKDKPEDEPKKVVVSDGFVLPEKVAPKEHKEPEQKTPSKKTPSKETTEEKPNVEVKIATKKEEEAKKKRKDRRDGPAHTYEKLLKTVKKKGKPLVFSYDVTVGDLKQKYKTAATRAVRSGNQGPRDFWAEELRVLEETGMPPEEDAGVPVYAKKLRDGYRKRATEASKELKLLQIDTLDRLELLKKRYNREKRYRHSRQAGDKAISWRNFESFLQDLREK